MNTFEWDVIKYRFKTIKFFLQKRLIVFPLMILLKRLEYWKHAQAAIITHYHFDMEDDNETTHDKHLDYWKMTCERLEKKWNKGEEK